MCKITAVILAYRPDEKLKMIVSRLKAQTVIPDKILIMHTVDEGVNDTELEWAYDMENVVVEKVKKQSLITEALGTRLYSCVRIWIMCFL